MQIEDGKRRKVIEPIQFFDEPAQAPLPNDIRTKDVEEKVYIILYQLNEDDLEEMFQNIYVISRGRTPAYEDIQSKLEAGLNIDIHRSKVLVETKQTQTSTNNRKYYLIGIDDAISLYSFCKSIEGDYNNYDFNIEDYNNTEVPEEDEDITHVGLDKLTPEQEEYLNMLYGVGRIEDRMFNTANDTNEDNNI